MNVNLGEMCVSVHGCVGMRVGESWRGACVCDSVWIGQRCEELRQNPHLCAQTERRKRGSHRWLGSVCLCESRSQGSVDESHFTAPITGLCSANVV